MVQKYLISGFYRPNNHIIIENMQYSTTYQTFLDK